MNDQQLIEALRRVDRPVAPDPAFADALFVDLQGRTRRRQPSRPLLLLVAALLAAATLAAGLMVGSNRPPNPLLTTTPEEASPTPPAYTVEVPSGVPTRSTPDQAAAAVLAAWPLPPLELEEPVRIESVIWLPADTEYRRPDGGALMSEEPSWVVTLVGTDGERDAVFVDDGTLRIWGSDGGPEEPAPTIDFSTPGPRAPLQLAGEGGLTVTPTVIDLPDADLRPQVGPLVASGDAVWAAISFSYQDLPPYVVRVDARTNETRRIELEGATQASGPALLAVGPEAVWAAANGRLHRIDPASGDVVDTIPLNVDAAGMHLDAEGLWVSRSGGVALIDPGSGEIVREIETDETGEHPYRWIEGPPAFGTLWDVDRTKGTVQRLNRVSGETVAEIQLPEDVDLEPCSDPRLVRGLPGGDAMGVGCGTAHVLIDPETNEVRGVVDSRAWIDVVVDGGWWWLRQPEDARWQEPGSLVQVDAATGDDIAVLTFNRGRTAGFGPVAAGDSLWFVVAERETQDQPYERWPELVRVPLSELPRE